MKLFRSLRRRFSIGKSSKHDKDNLGLSTCEMGQFETSSTSSKDSTEILWIVQREKQYEDTESLYMLIEFPELNQPKNSAEKEKNEAKEKNIEKTEYEVDGKSLEIEKERGTEEEEPVFMLMEFPEVNQKRRSRRVMNEYRRYRGNSNYKYTYKLLA